MGPMLIEWVHRAGESEVGEAHGPLLVRTAEWLRLAAHLADLPNLSFYDGSSAAGVAVLQVPLVSADRRLLAAGLGESARDAVHPLRLHP